MRHYLPDSIAQRFNVDTKDVQSLRIFWLRNIYDKDVRDNYLYKVLNNVKSRDSWSIIDFIKTIFLPRVERALNYTKEIEMIKFKKIETRRCMDIEKLQKIAYYKSRQITKYNIIKVEMPPYFLSMFKIAHIERKPIISNSLLEIAETLANVRSKHSEIIGNRQMQMGCFHYQDPKFEI